MCSAKRLEGKSPNLDQKASPFGKPESTWEPNNNSASQQPLLWKCATTGSHQMSSLVWQTGGETLANSWGKKWLARLCFSSSVYKHSQIKTCKDGHRGIRNFRETIRTYLWKRRAEEPSSRTEVLPKPRTTAQKSVWSAADAGPHSVTSSVS